ncbi:MAG: uridine kinase [Myxococcales bacterium 68-20]|nr:uridine kinase [Myxococcales bacterium]OJY30852.1 MAG: uridine kinase [Myxococcales bacterium 68-20]
MQPPPSFRPPLVLGIAGGSGSGKSTIARAVLEALPPGSGVMLQQDHYYRPQTHLPESERESVNYDHPDALELDLMTQHLDALRSGKSIQRPTYDFTVHDRAKDGVLVEPAAIIVVEGILVLADERLRSRFEVKLYVDTDPDIRVMRRIRRDLEHRGRSFGQIRKQYYESVRPMHLAFVEPSKRFADIVIPEGGQNQVALDFLLSFVRQRASEGG